MPPDLDKVIAKLGDKGVQNRIQSAIRNATFHALKKEGIELSPAEWGELTARAIAAKTDKGGYGVADMVLVCTNAAAACAEITARVAASEIAVLSSFAQQP